MGDGHAAISLNFSLNGIGDRPMEFTELEAFGRNTLSRELDELLLVLDALREPGIVPLPPRRIGILGHSRGGGDAVLAAAARPVDALVTWAAVATFDRWSPEAKEEWRKAGRIYVLNGRTGQQMPLDLGLLEDWEAHRERLDIEAAAARLEAPWLILHGDADEAVSSRDARRLARAGARGRVRLHLVEGGGHTFGVGHPFAAPTPEFEEALRLTRQHFRKHLLEGGA